MSATIYKTFIFTENESHRVLKIKRSLDFNFAMSSENFNTYFIKSKEILPLCDDFLFTYTPFQGLQVVPPPAKDHLEKMAFLKRKIEILIGIKANIGVARKKFNLQFDEKALLKTPIRKKNFVIYWKFMNNEKRIALKKMSLFFKVSQQKIESASSAEALDKEYQQLVANTNIGVYSPMYKKI